MLNRFRKWLSVREFALGFYEQIYGQSDIDNQDPDYVRGCQAAAAHVGRAAVSLSKTKGRHREAEEALAALKVDFNKQKDVVAATRKAVVYKSKEIDALQTKLDCIEALL